MLQFSIKYYTYIYIPNFITLNQLIQQNRQSIDFPQIVNQDRILIQTEITQIIYSYIRIRASTSQNILSVNSKAYQYLFQVLTYLSTYKYIRCQLFFFYYSMEFFRLYCFKTSSQLNCNYYYTPKQSITYEKEHKPTSIQRQISTTTQLLFSCNYPTIKLRCIDLKTITRKIVLSLRQQISTHIFSMLKTTKSIYINLYRSLSLSRTRKRLYYFAISNHQISPQIFHNMRNKYKLQMQARQIRRYIASMKV
eukprot:TRINITY_DN5574_c1_g1_i5.p1 TRINITY_DN5574_c1_g1~~TRINITY_DN5574_c1_g1_i5.p1  ORF type:complete len:251 (+),score=-42.36 TRINITY_DN5574_c1_g1_i5:1191-1943(+)